MSVFIMSAPTEQERAKLDCLAFLPVEGKWTGTRFITSELDLETVKGPADTVDAKLTWDGIVHSADMESSITLRSWQAALDAKVKRAEDERKRDDERYLRERARDMEKERKDASEDTKKRRALEHLVDKPTEGKINECVFSCLNPKLIVNLEGCWPKAHGIKGTLYPDGTILAGKTQYKVSTESWIAELYRRTRPETDEFKESLRHLEQLTDTPFDDEDDEDL
jgi:hypothetical protein